MKILNPISGELRDVNDVRDRILRKRFANIQIAKDANSFLILISSKVGQNRKELADSLLKMINDSGKVGYRIIMEEISPQALMSYKVDAYVNTACPRIAMDDSEKYSHPILTPIELEIVLGKREWDDYMFDEIVNK